MINMILIFTAIGFFCPVTAELQGENSSNPSDTCLVLKKGYLIEIKEIGEKTNVSYALENLFFEQIPEFIEVEEFIRKGDLVDINYFDGQNLEKIVLSNKYKPYYCYSPDIERLNGRYSIKIYSVELVFFKKKLTIDDYCSRMRGSGNHSFFCEPNISEGGMLSVIFPQVITPL